MFRNLISLTIIASLLASDVAVLSHRHTEDSETSARQSAKQSPEVHQCACSHHHCGKVADVERPVSDDSSEERDTCLICAAKYLTRLDTSFQIDDAFAFDDVPEFADAIGYLPPHYEFYLLLGSPLRGPPCA